QVSNDALRARVIRNGVGRRIDDQRFPGGEHDPRLTLDTGAEELDGPVHVEVTRQMELARRDEDRVAPGVDAVDDRVLYTLHHRAVRSARGRVVHLRAEPADVHALDEESLPVAAGGRDLRAAVVGGAA